MARLPLRTNLGYGIADFGQNLLFQTVGIYLLSFYTDVAMLSAAFAGNLFLLTRIWDGINDPLMGYLAQRTRSRWGTYRPWLLWMAFPVGISFVLLFLVPDVSQEGKQWYAIITYVVFTMAFTAMNIPYGTLTAVMTPDYAERGRLTGYRMTFAMVGAILAGYAFLTISGKWEDASQGYFWAACLFALILIITLGIGFFTVREELTTQIVPSLSLSTSWAALRSNRPFWMLSITFGSCFVAYAVFVSILPYLGRYLLGDEEVTANLLLVVMGTTAASIPVWTWLSKRIGKKAVFLAGASFYILAMAGLFFLESDQHTLVYGWLLIHGLGNGAAVFTSWAMIADTIEYGQWKSGIRLESMIYGVYGFFIKLGIGIGIWLAGQGLSLGGYVANGEQSEEALRSIRLLVSLVPLVWIVIAVIAMMAYRIDPALHQRIRDEIQA
ncbi:MAG: MFS transporter [Bacteroidota bacterium]